METIKEICKQMRDAADDAEKKNLYDMREWGTDNLRAIADRIEKANENERKNWNQWIKEVNKSLHILVDSYFAYDNDNSKKEDK